MAAVLGMLVNSLPATASAQVLRWASGGDMHTLDSHAQNDALSKALRVKSCNDVSASYIQAI